MPRLIDTTETKERLPGPMPANRLCGSCGAILSRYNPSGTCAPCGGWPRKQMVQNVDELNELLEAA